MSAHAAEIEARDQARASDQELIARLSRIIRDLQCMSFGARSEKLNPDKLTLTLEDLEQELAAAEARLATPPACDLLSGAALAGYRGAADRRRSLSSGGLSV